MARSTVAHRARCAATRWGNRSHRPCCAWRSRSTKESVFFLERGNDFMAVTSIFRPGLFDGQVFLTTGGQVLAQACDIRDEKQVNAQVQAVLERFGRLDGLVNNAGGQFFSPAENITPRGWQAVIETNLTGTFYMSQAAMRHWMGKHGGVI